MNFCVESGHLQELGLFCLRSAMVSVSRRCNTLCHRGASPNWMFGRMLMMSFASECGIDATMNLATGSLACDHPSRSSVRMQSRRACLTERQQRRTVRRSKAQADGCSVA